MDTMELQNTAESVLDLEARIGNWIGDISQWIKELTQLHKILELKINCVPESRDSLENEFLKSLLEITDHCEQIVITRACIEDPGINPSVHFTLGCQKQHASAS